MNTPFQFGLRVSGAAHEPRRLVNWRKAWAAHCAGELDTNEAYLSAFTYGPEMVAHMKAAGSVAGYAEPVFAEYVTLDLDGTGADPVADALDRARRLLAWMETAAAANLDAVPCWFSGGKGFHVMISMAGLEHPGMGTGPEPGAAFNGTARRFALLLDGETRCKPDPAVFDKVRIIRAPNTRHPKSGLYKVRIPADELLALSADGVRRLAAEPRPVELAEPVAGWCDWTLPELWGRAQLETRNPAPAPAPADRCALNRDTLAFIRAGAPPGERERRCFMAAANLAELGADERLAGALLLDAALDCGLAPGEARRAVSGGVKHALDRTCRKPNSEPCALAVSGTTKQGAGGL